MGKSAIPLTRVRYSRALYPSNGLLLDNTINKYSKVTQYWVYEVLPLVKKICKTKKRGLLKDHFIAGFCKNHCWAALMRGNP